jgi:hypothetical protein
MSASHISNSMITGLNIPWSQDKQLSLMQGEIFLQTLPHTAWGGAVTAWMYLPLLRSHVWQQLTDYRRWVEYFPDIIKSQFL